MPEENQRIRSEEIDTDTYIHLLSITDPLREPIIRSAIQTLRLPKGSRGLDAGCGIGSQALLLAEAIGPPGHVTGLDINPEMLNHARAVTAEKGLADRISFKEGRIENLPFEDDAFNWLWSADCAGYGTKDPIRILTELARVVRPEGTVAILIYSSQQLLPGYPMLEARLNATAQGIEPFTLSMKSKTHWLRALGWFRKASIETPRVKTFIHTVSAPMSDSICQALTALIHMRWEGAESELNPNDLAEYQRRSDPTSRDFILNLPDYYGFFTYSMFWGKVCKR